MSRLESEGLSPDTARDTLDSAPLSPDDISGMSPQELIEAAKVRRLLGPALFSVYVMDGTYDMEKALTLCDFIRTQINIAFLARERTDHPEHQFYQKLNEFGSEDPNKKQAFLTFLATAPQLHFDAAGNEVSLTEYLRSHYAPLVEEGLTISIEEVDATTALAIHLSILGRSEAFKDSQIKQDMLHASNASQSIPVLTLTYHGTVKRIPILYSSSLDSEANTLGTYWRIPSQIGHDTETYCDTIFVNPNKHLSSSRGATKTQVEISSTVVHEIDHAIACLTTISERKNRLAQLELKYMSQLSGIESDDSEGSRRIMSALAQESDAIQSEYAHYAFGESAVLEGLATEAQRMYSEHQATGLNNHSPLRDKDETGNFLLKGMKVVNRHIRASLQLDPESQQYAVGSTLIGLMYHPDNFKRLYASAFPDVCIVRKTEITEAIRAALPSFQT